MMFNLALVSGNQVISWMDLFQQKIHGWWVGGMKMLPNLLLAIVFWILFFLFAKLLRKLVFRIANHFSKSKAIGGLFSEVVNVIIIGIGLYIGLNILKLDKIAISMLAGAGIVGLTLAFAFQDLTSNFISGVYIDFNKPFDIGDIIQSGNIMGEVEEIGLRSTSIRTSDGLMLLVPNKTIFQNTITNFSRTQQRQVTVDFLVSIQDSMEDIEKMVVDAIKDIKDLHTGRKIECYYTDFNQQQLKVSVLFWINTFRQSDTMAAKHAAILAILKAFKDEDLQRLK
jgi:small conductance mechanosensitive channel